MHNTHITPAMILYWPGTGGNFLTLCLSLSPECVPYYNKDLKTLTDSEIDQLQNITVEQRLEIMSYRSSSDFSKIHGGKNFFVPDIHYNDPRINNYFKKVILSNHPDACDQRLPWMDKILYLDPDCDCQTWIDRAFEQFSTVEKRPFGHTQLNHLDPIKWACVQEITQDPRSITVSLTNILNNTETFWQEYQRMCDFLNITPQTLVKRYYQEWRLVRVDPFF